MNKLSTERAIEALDTVRAYYASLTAGFPKGKDCKGIGDVMCSEIANSCLMAIQALKEQENPNSIRINFVGKEEVEEFKEYLKNQQPCEDCISRQAVLDMLENINAETEGVGFYYEHYVEYIKNLSPVTPQPKMGKWFKSSIGGAKICSICQAHIGLSNFKYCPNCGAKMESEDKE